MGSQSWFGSSDGFPAAGLVCRSSHLCALLAKKLFIFHGGVGEVCEALFDMICVGDEGSYGGLEALGDCTWIFDDRWRL